MAPTALLLDSWELLLSEILVSRLSSHAERYERSSFGSIPDRSLAHVVDFVESHLGSDLDLASLAKMAAMSPYHFARRFKARLGVSPHA
jgi:AraC family transcriptional regulator